MIVAVTYKDGYCYEHFGTTPQFKIYTVEGSIVKQEIVDTDKTGHTAMVSFLKERNVETLICGDIGPEAFKALTNSNIDIYAGYSDNADVCFVALLHNNLLKTEEYMCSGHGEGGCECGENCECGGDCSSCG